MSTNWQNAPEWARYAAVDVFSGKKYFSSTRPREEAGWTQIEERPGKDDQWRQILPEGYRQPAKWPKGCAAVVHGQGGVEWVKHPAPEFAWAQETDHAAELAEALEAAMYWMHGDCLGDYDKCKKVLANYKQSRGE
ncbi:hypothetical protein [Zhongshania sp.]|uniref:hypothetical protein n=1 Tax=Zhongshania sp. TaxID=1971902 RepID=UPI0035695217